MSRFAVSLLLTAALLFSIGLFAQATTPGTSPAASTPPAASAPAAPKADVNPKDEAHRTIENLAPQLNLTADQKAKLEPILTNEIQQVHDLRANTSMTIQQKQATFQQTLTADHSKIDAILTPEQKTKLAQLHQQQDAQQQQSQPPAAPSQQSPK